MTLVPTNTATPWSTLVDVPTCPKCERIFYGIEDDGQSIRGRLSCRAKGCTQEWWIMRLAAGSVLPQLCLEISEPFMAIRIVEEYHLPDRMERPTYWQLALDSNQVYHRRRAVEYARVSGTAVPAFPLSLRSRIVREALGVSTDQSLALYSVTDQAHRSTNLSP